MWTVCYDYESAGLRDFLPLVWGIGLFAFGLFAIWYDRKDYKSNPTEASSSGKYFLYVWAALALLWTLGVGHDVNSHYTELRSIIQEQRYETTEGTIADFEVTTDSRRSTTYYTFTVNGHPFKVTANRLKSTCKPGLANGRTVRVEYEGDTVLRVWVSEEG